MPLLTVIVVIIASMMLSGPSRSTGQKISRLAKVTVPLVLASDESLKWTKTCSIAEFEGVVAEVGDLIGEIELELRSARARFPALPQAG